MFQPIKNKKVYEFVIEQIQEMLLDGRLKVGDRLPSERDLTEQLGVSRTSIREAMRALEILGLVESRQGEGNFISGDLGDNIFQPLSVLFMLNQGKFENVLELREVLEIQSVSLAVDRATDKNIEELQALVSALNITENEAKAAHLDAEFHYKIAEMTGNSLMLSLFKAISVLMEAFIKDARVRIHSDPINHDLLNMIHKSVCDGIAQRNRTKALSAMESHFTLINTYYLKAAKSAKGEN